MIELTFEKVVTGAGELRYRLLKFSGKSRQKLPHLYRNGIHASISDSIYIFSEEDDLSPTVYRTGQELTPAEFTSLIEVLRQCGERLHEVNAQLAAIRAEWHGEVQVII